MSLQKILEDLTGYIEFERDEGTDRIEVSADCLSSLRATRKNAPMIRRLPAQKPVPATPQRPPQPPSRATSPTVPPPPSPAAPDAAKRAEALKQIANQVAACKKCVLHAGRTRTVPGQGSVSPELMFIGEGPGQDEDRQGLAFVGRAGQLLTKMIEAMGFKRDDVFIGNVVKCRPPENRTPMPDEMEACLPYLKAQIAILKPKVIVALGATAVKGLLNVPTGITRLRGTWLSFEGIDVMPTYHPAYLLRNPPAKKDVWEDLQAVLARLGRTPPPRAAR